MVRISNIRRQDCYSDGNISSLLNTLRPNDSCVCMTCSPVFTSKWPFDRTRFPIYKWFNHLEGIDNSPDFLRRRSG